MEADKDFLTYQTTIDYESECGNRWQIFNPPKKLIPPRAKKYFFPLICNDFEQRDGKIKTAIKQIAGKRVPAHIFYPAA